MFTTIGICETFGVKKIALIGGAVGAVIGGIYGWAVSKTRPLTTTQKILYIVGGAALIGGGIGMGAYFTCKGVKSGIPIRSR